MHPQHLSSSTRRGLALLGAAVTTALLSSLGGPATAVEPRAREATTAAGPGSPRLADQRYDAATRRDPEFRATFAHRFAQVDDVRMHYVEGGTGEQTLVLLHGWPSTWYEWREVMPALAEDFRVIAVDLPGLGDSTGSPPSYDKVTLARYVSGLTDQLGIESFSVAAHDFGAGVAYQVAVQHPERVETLIPMDFPLAGEGEYSAAALADELWHFAFHYQPEIPEAVVGDDVRDYLELFYPLYSPDPAPVSRVAVNEAVRTYSRPSVLAGGFELYRTVAQDEVDNTADTDPLPMPVRYLGSPSSPFEGSWTAVDPDVEVVLADRSVGHWIPEEDPDFVVEQIRDVALR